MTRWPDRLSHFSRRNASLLVAALDSIHEIVRGALQQYVEDAQVERKTLAATYAEFAEEDRQLAQIGLTHYAHVLAQEQAAWYAHP